jgi:ATP-dependent DNA helicase RecG
MKVDKIREVLNLGESQNVEFKTDCLDISIIGPSVCGFLNTNGGYLICGVSDDTGEIIGFTGSDASVKHLEQGLMQDLSPKALVYFQVQEVEGIPLLVVEVPAGKDLPYAFQDIIYLREGQSTRRADLDTIRDMVLRKQVEPERWERRFSSAELPRNLDLKEIHSMVKGINRRSRFQFRDSDNPIQVLEDLSVSRYGRLTNAGDVLFGANPAIRYPQIRVRAVSSTRDRADDTYRDLNTFEGPLVSVLEEVYAFIRRNTSTRSRFSTGDLERQNKKTYPPTSISKEFSRSIIAGDLERQDEPLYPREAIREGLINAFAHRDYSDFSGGITVFIFPDRLEIWNSGQFPEGVTSTTLLTGQISVLRNPDIAHVLYLRGLMENLGRGSILIQRACINHGLPPPKWSEDNVGVTLTFFAPDVTPYVTPEVTPYVPPEVTPEVRRLLGVLDDELSRQIIQDRLYLKDSKHFREVYLQPAIQAGLVEMTLPDTPRSSRQQYRLTEKGRALLAGEYATPHVTPEATTLPVTPQVTPHVTPEATTPHVTPQVTPLVTPEAMTLPVTPQVTPHVTSKPTPEVWRLLGVLDDELSRQIIQDRLGLKDSKHVRKVYLQPAIQAGLVEMTQPDKPRSSRQQYRLTEKGRALLAGEHV